MKPMLNKKLFFSMTYDFLTVYIPQDSASSRTVKTVYSTRVAPLARVF